MIDLRSDTFTAPDEDMRKAMAAAPVGDDVFGEDPTVNELEEFTAGLLGKEAALYVPSGTMSNQIALALNTRTGDEVICEADAHIYYYETAGPSIISRVQIRPVPSDRGEMPLSEIEKSIRPDIYYYPRTSLICLENTHNRHGGTILSREYISEVSELAKSRGLGLHLDGARIWNAAIATDIQPIDWAAPFDTVSVCFSKGLGAPVGSCLTGSRDKIEAGRKIRKILGGGMRQAGIIAAGALYALRENMEKLALDHENAGLFARSINESEYIDVDLSTVETNIVMFHHDPRINQDGLYKELTDAGVNVIPIGNSTIRAVFWLGITRRMAEQAAVIVKQVIEKISRR
ncbi:MAG: threonine aldolase family protein [Candidatus Kapaibacterium sp.]